MIMQAFEQVSVPFGDSIYLNEHIKIIYAPMRRFRPLRGLYISKLMKTWMLYDGERIEFPSPSGTLYI